MGTGNIRCTKAAPAAIAEAKTRLVLPASSRISEKERVTNVIQEGGRDSIGAAGRGH